MSDEDFDIIIGLHAEEQHRREYGDYRGRDWTPHEVTIVALLVLAFLVFLAILLGAPL